ncbi:hypothetical protein CHARACLAT_021914 [Characodon lateralis]|uniref:Uncharacterized protein n=1 Tax=Characodon lateralis TaxID=208331 RepID=A0ABU7D9J6_9TELE|nr:hypothetical protein [Characodon lateralis]
MSSSSSCGGQSASIRAASGGLRRKVKQHLSYFTLFMNECWVLKQQDHYLTLLHTVGVIAVTFGSKLKSYVCLAASRHLCVVSFRPVLLLEIRVVEAAMLEHRVFVQTLMSWGVSYGSSSSWAG